MVKLIEHPKVGRKSDRPNVEKPNGKTIQEAFLKMLIEWDLPWLVPMKIEES